MKWNDMSRKWCSKRGQWKRRRSILGAIGIPEDAEEFFDEEIGEREDGWGVHYLCCLQAPANGTCVVIIHESIRGFNLVERFSTYKEGLDAWSQLTIDYDDWAKERFERY